MKHKSPFDGLDKEKDLFKRAWDALGGDGDKLTPDEVVRKMSELSAADWSEQMVQDVLKQGRLAIFTRLVTNYPPQALRQMDLELMALKQPPTSTEWRSAIDGVRTGCLGFPERVQHVVLDYLRWRRAGLLGHGFCRCHGERN